LSFKPIKTKPVLAALAITVIFFLLGWLICGILLEGFYKENTIECA